MTEEEFLARVYEHEGIVYGEPWGYNDGVTTQSLRSGVDGPYTKLADELCSLRRDCL